MNRFQLIATALGVFVLLVLWVWQKRRPRKSRTISEAIQDSDRVAQDRRDVLAERDFDKNAADTLDSEGGSTLRQKRAAPEYEHQH